MKPSARYHSDDGWVVHGATDVPAAWVARCSTRPPPPSISTIAPTNGATTDAEGSMVAREYGSTVIGSSVAWPGPASSVTRACIGAGPALARTNAPPLPSAPSAGTPGQNQVLVSAAPEGTDGIHGARVVANAADSGAGVSPATATNAPAAATVTASIGSRRRIIQDVLPRRPLPPRRAARRPRRSPSGPEAVRLGRRRDRSASRPRPSGAGTWLGSSVGWRPAAPPPRAPPARAARACARAAG